MYPHYVIVRRTRKAFMVEYHVVGIFNDIVEAMLEANRRNYSEEASGDKTTFVVRGLQHDQRDGAERRLRSIEKMGTDVYSSNVIRVTAQEIRDSLR